MPFDLQVRVPYLANDPRYDVEKPYAIAFPVDELYENIKQHNQEIDLQNATIFDARADSQAGVQRSLDTNGFQMVQSELNFTADMFESSAFVRGEYFPLVERLIKQAFPQYRDIVYSDHVLRKRSRDFPSNQGKRVAYAQPLTIPHVDYTTYGSDVKLGQLISEGKCPHHFRERPYDQLNVWRVLKGPNNDWPLAFCDSQTVDFQADAMASDLIFRDIASENMILKGSNRHRWYYLSDQMPNEVMIFRNTSSADRDLPRGFHAAVDAASAREADFGYRCSLEIRVFAFI